MVKNLLANAGDAGGVGSIPGLRRFPQRGKWQPIPVFLPEESHGQRSLAVYSPRGCERVGHHLATKQQQVSMNNKSNNNNRGLCLKAHAVYFKKFSSLFNSTSLCGGLFQAVLLWNKPVQHLMTESNKDLIISHNSVSRQGDCTRFIWKVHQSGRSQDGLIHVQHLCWASKHPSVHPLTLQEARPASSLGGLRGGILRGLWQKTQGLLRPLFQSCMTSLLPCFIGQNQSQSQPLFRSEDTDCATPYKEQHNVLTISHLRQRECVIYLPHLIGFS